MDAEALANTQQSYTRVDRKKLVTRLKKNHTNHVECYDEALKGWRQDFSVALKKTANNLAELAAKAEDPGVDLDDIERPHLDLPQRPATHGDEYTTAIARFSLSLDEHIWLSHEEFNTLVMDQWHWKGGFAASVRVYAPPGVYAKSLCIPDFESDFAVE